MTDAPEKFTKNDIAGHPNPNCLWVRLVAYQSLEAENKQLRAAIARAEDLKPRDRWEIKDAGHDYCAGIRDVLAALGVK